MLIEENGIFWHYIIEIHGKTPLTDEYILCNLITN